MTAVITFAREGGEWVGRATGAGSNLVIRIRRTGSKNPWTAVVAGTANGLAWDGGVPPYLPPSGVAVTVAGTADQTSGTLDGEMALLGNFTSGVLSGRIAFSDSTGATSSCSAITWSMTH